MGGSPSPERIYLDYQATTPCDPRVVAAMTPYFTEAFGNPHSQQHSFGRAAAAAVEQAREEIAGLVGARGNEIVFTSGATEANNLAIKGAARFHAARGRRLVTVATEHKSVLEPFRRLGEEGFALTVVPVDRDGLVRLDALARAITAETVLVSVMAANSEIGVIQPLAEIGALCRERGVLFHTDAAQAFGKIALNVEATQVDLMSLSAHKAYGPKGIGALYVRRRPRARLAPLFDGGGQERGLRSGTLPTPLCVGFGAAAAIARREMAEEAERIGALRDRLRRALGARLPGLRLNGHATRRLPGNLNLAFPGIDGPELMDELDGIALASGSACTSAALEPSHVLRALGLEDAVIHSSLRISLGRFTTETEIDAAAERIANAVLHLRAAAAA
jgi:cysteine desulfurase